MLFIFRIKGINNTKCFFQIGIWLAYFFGFLWRSVSFLADWCCVFLKALMFKMIHCIWSLELMGAEPGGSMTGVLSISQGNLSPLLSFNPTQFSQFKMNIYNFTFSILNEKNIFFGAPEF